jgi:hypothetical protein
VHESGLAQFDHNEGRVTGCRQEDNWTVGEHLAFYRWSSYGKSKLKVSAWGPTYHVDGQTITLYNNVTVPRISSHLLYAHQVHVLVV